MLVTALLISLPLYSQPVYPYQNKKGNQSQDPIMKYTQVTSNDIVSIKPGIDTRILIVYFDSTQTRSKKTICDEVLHEVGLKNFPKGTFNVPFMINGKKRFFIFSPGAKGLILVSPGDKEKIQFNVVHLHDTLRDPIPFTMLPDMGFAYIDSTFLVEYRIDGQIRYYNVSALLNNTPDDISLEPFKNETDGEVIFVKINGKPVGGVARKNGDLLIVNGKK